jgi:hypothetical protein
LLFSTAETADISGGVRKLLHIFHMVFHIFKPWIVENRIRIFAHTLQKLMKHVKEVVA